MKWDNNFNCVKVFPFNELKTYHTNIEKVKCLQYLQENFIAKKWAADLRLPIKILISEFNLYLFFPHKWISIIFRWIEISLD